MHEHTDTADWPYWLSLGGHTSDHCRPFAVWLTISLLMLAIVVLYFGIAADALDRERKAGVVIPAMRSKMFVFLLCGLTRLFEPLAWFVPAYSLYIVGLVALLVVTWRFWRQRDSYDIVVTNHEKANAFDRMMLFDASSDPHLVCQTLREVGAELAQRAATRKGR